MPPRAGTILRRTAHGAGWIVGWRMARRLLGFASTVILARLLLPSDFGLVALASGIAGSLDAVSSLGVEDGIIRAKHQSRELFDTGFTLNLIRGIGTAVALVAVAVPAARFFGDSRLAMVLVVLAASSLLTSVMNIGTTDFRRTLAFDKEFVLLIVPRILGTSVTVIVALITRSYWALLAGIMTTRSCTVVASYIMHPYRPRLALGHWRDLAGFSFWMWAISVVQLVRDRTDQLLIGRLLGDAEVGIYSVGWEVAHLPTSELVGPLGTASFAGFSAAQHTDENIGRIYLRVIAAVSLVVLPAGIGISAVATPLVRVMLGPNWAGVAPVVVLAAAVSTTAGFGIITTSLLTAFGRMGSQFRITLLFTVMRVALLVWLVPLYGLIGAVAVAGFGMAAEFGTYVVLAFRYFGLALRDLLAVIWRPLVGVSAMAMALAYTGLGWIASGSATSGAVRQLAIASAVGAIVYCGSVALLWFASGRPAGSAEADVTELLLTALKQLPWRTRLPAHPGARH